MAGFGRIERLEARGYDRAVRVDTESGSAPFVFVNHCSSVRLVRNKLSAVLTSIDGEVAAIRTQSLKPYEETAGAGEMGEHKALWRAYGELQELVKWGSTRHSRFACLLCAPLHSTLRS